MPDIPPALQGLSLDGLLAEGLRPVAPVASADWVPPTPEELKGVIPRHEIIRLIGRGGMGAVYEARQVDLERQVAIKLLPPALGADEAFAERFRREAHTMARLRHPNILSVFEFGESAAGHLYFSMEYVAGGDLGTRMKRGPLSPAEALRLVKELCAALEVAHAHGVIHRDIKPANILLAEDGSVKVADFGIAMLGGRPLDRLTHTGQTVGTFEYAAPEQAAGALVDHRSDLYSVGVVCYEMLTGQLPRGIFDPPSKVNAAVNSAVDPVVHTAMQNDPARRYQTASELQQAIVHSETAPAPSPKKPNRTMAVAGLVLFLVASALVFVVQRHQAVPRGFESGAAAQLAPTATDLETRFAALTRPGADLKPLHRWTFECDELAQRLMTATHGPEATVAYLSDWIARVEQQRARFPEETRWNLALATLLQRRGVTLERTEPGVALKTFQYASALLYTALKKTPNDHATRFDTVVSLCKVLDGHATCQSPPEQVFASCQESTAIFATIKGRESDERWFDQYFGSSTATTLVRLLAWDPNHKPGVRAAARSALAALNPPGEDLPEPLRSQTLATRERLQQLAE